MTRSARISTELENEPYNSWDYTYDEDGIPLFVQESGVYSTEWYFSIECE